MRRATRLCQCPVPSGNGKASGPSPAFKKGLPIPLPAPLANALLTCGLRAGSAPGGARLNRSLLLPGALVDSSLPAVTVSESHRGQPAALSALAVPAPATRARRPAGTRRHGGSPLPGVAVRCSAAKPPGKAGPTGASASAKRITPAHWRPASTTLKESGHLHATQEEAHALQLQAEWDAGRGQWQAEWDARSLPPFVPAKAYSPPPPGFVFKLGEEGLGFYRDTRPVLSLYYLLGHGATEATPLRLRLNEQIPVADQPDHAKLSAAQFSRMNPRQQRKHLRDAASHAQVLAAAGTVQDAPRQPGDPGPRMRPHHGQRSRTGPLQCTRHSLQGDIPEQIHWPDDGSLAASCTRHRSAEVWAVDTVNANAWQGTLDYLRHTSADIVVAQETRLASERCAAAEASLLTDGVEGRHTPMPVRRQWRQVGGQYGSGAKAHWPKRGARCHLGLATARRYIMCQGCWRGSEGMHYCRLLLPSHGCRCDGQGESGPAPRNGGCPTPKRRSLDAWGGEGGAFSCTPDQLQSTGWLDLVGGRIVAPTAPTCGERVIYFFVVGASLAHAPAREVPPYGKTSGHATAQPSRAQADCGKRSPTGPLPSPRSLKPGRARTCRAASGQWSPVCLAQPPGSQWDRERQHDLGLQSVVALSGLACGPAQVQQRHHQSFRPLETQVASPPTPE